MILRVTRKSVIPIPDGVCLKVIVLLSPFRRRPATPTTMERILPSTYNIVDTSHWNRHGVVTVVACSTSGTRPKFAHTHRNWFLKFTFTFHISRLSAPQNRSTIYINLSVFQILQKFTHKFLSCQAVIQTNGSEIIAYSRKVALIISFLNIHLRFAGETVSLLQIRINLSLSKRLVIGQ